MHYGLTHHDITPPDDEGGLCSHQKRVEAQMVHRQVQPALAWDETIPVATQVNCGQQKHLAQAECRLLPPKY